MRSTTQFSRALVLPAHAADCAKDDVPEGTLLPCLAAGFCGPIVLPAAHDPGAGRLGQAY
ncbi:MAG: hypothetical protein ACE5GS_00435 [Kiloniellaceae bacterium]